MRPIGVVLLLALALSGCVAQQGADGITGTARDDALGEAGDAETMAPGQVGRACAVGRRPAGQVVEQWPTDGRARWRIYDTAPGSTRPRTHYITGFSDGCARQVTAAMVVFGGPAVYEALRYSSANQAPPSATDALYERIKSRICGVRSGAACPSARMGRLEARTTFVSVYPRLGEMSERLELLLDNGDLVAQAQVR